MRTYNTAEPNRISPKETASKMTAADRATNETTLLAGTPDQEEPQPAGDDRGAQGTSNRREIRRPRRTAFRALLAAAVAGGTSVVLPGAVAYAGGYYNPWAGNPVINYAYQGKAVGSNLQKLLPAPVPGLDQEFNSAWAASEPGVCHKIEDYLESALGSFTGWKCNLPSSGDLEGALLAPNELGLNFGLSGISISLDYLAAGIDWVTIDGTFDAQAHITLDVANEVDWSDPSQSPVRVASSLVSFSGADFSSANVLLHIFDPSALSKADNKVDSTVIAGAAPMLGLTSDILTLNGDLGSAATAIADLYVLPEYPDAAQGFSLTIGVDSSHVILTFGRGGSPEPAPRGCEFYPDWSGFAPGTTEVDATCSPSEARGVGKLVLQEQRRGAWTHNPKDAQYEPGDPASWVSQLAPAPYVAWQPNNGPGSGYAPYMTDYPVVQQGAPTVQMRVCSSNQWGFNCTAPHAVDQVVGGAGGSGAGGSGGGGGGGYGGGGVSPVTGQNGKPVKYM